MFIIKFDLYYRFIQFVFVSKQEVHDTIQWLLMHVDTLKCLQQSERFGDYWLLVLQECKNTETKQFWKCQGQTFFLKNDNTINLYIIDRAWGTIRKIKHTLSRYSSGKYLCSKGIVELFLLLLCRNIESRYFQLMTVVRNPVKNVVCFL